MSNSQSQPQDFNYEDVLSGVEDQAGKAIVQNEIKDIMASSMNDQDRPNPLPRSTRQRILQTANNTQFGAPMQRVEQQQSEYDYAQDHKRLRQYQVCQPPKFKIIGFDKKKMPIFRMTDLYLTDDPEVRNSIEQLLNNAIFGGRQVSVGFSSKFDNRAELAEILAKWQNKEQQDFGAQKNNLMDQKQLEDVVVNMGQQKNDYFIYMNRQYQKQPFEAHEIQVENNPVSHPNFLQNLWKTVDRIQARNVNIEEFQSDSQKEEKGNYNAKINEKDRIQQNQEKLESFLWGRLKDQKPKERSNITNFRNNKEFSVQITSEGASDGFLNQAILRDLNYLNPHVASRDFFDKTIEDFNRIQFDLADPNFFLPKLNETLEKRIANPKLKKAQANRNLTTQLNVSVMNRGIAQSQVSGSRITGNRMIQRHINLGQGKGQAADDEHQTLQQRINKQLRTQGRQVINHTPVANRFQQTKFTIFQKDFQFFHRYSFPFAFHFKSSVSIQLAKHKPSKLKGTDLSVNSEYVSSHKKFVSPDSLSLANGQFVMVEYIQENPIVMSNVGMCERMLLQVNKDQMLEKVKQNMIDNEDFEDIERRRDNVASFQGKSFKQQSQLWRKNIRETFGDNGKVYLWDSRKEGKLIGSPDGAGVALMESKLGCVPVVKKKNKSTDFMLVRDHDRWVIRRIDNLYVSGQVQPKVEVYNPDSRNVTTTFMSNYLKAFILRSVRLLGRVNIEVLRGIFQTTTDTGIKKMLKSVSAFTQDGKHYTISPENLEQEMGLSPEDVCMFQSMQHSLSRLQKAGITKIRHNEKIKQIINILFKRHPSSLQRFAVSKMIKEQLQLTTWYLTQSFSAFKNGNAKIDLNGHADPTNNHGGYSFIKKPQKQRTQKQEMLQKPEKQKVSGTDHDLRKLKTRQTHALLLQRGYTPQQLTNKSRWQLVKLIRQQQGTQYARQQRQTKLMKLQLQKKDISKIFNRMLRILNQEETFGPYSYGLDRRSTLDRYMKRQRAHWERKKKMIELPELAEKEDQNQDEY